MKSIDQIIRQAQLTTGHTALAKLHEQVARQLAPFEQLRKQQELVKRLLPLDPLDQLGKHRSISSSYDFAQKIRRLTEHSFATQQVGKILEQQRLSASSNGVTDILRRAAPVEAVGQIALANQHYLRLISPSDEWISTLHRASSASDTLRQWTRHLEANPGLNALQKARESMQSLWRNIETPDLSHFELTVEEQAEAIEAAEVISQTAGAELTLEDAVTQIVNAINRQPNPSVKITLWMVFWKIFDWLVAAAVGAVMSQVLFPPGQTPPPQSVKAVKEVVRTVAPAELLSEHRIVSATQLIVRKNPRARSPEVGRVRFGNLVVVLKKENDFVLVNWTDPQSSSQVQGWVFARYLVKIS